jgi:hypothetical protein
MDFFRENNDRHSQIGPAETIGVVGGVLLLMPASATLSVVLLLTSRGRGSESN